MTGRELYELFCALDEEINNCGADGWDDLDPATREVWDALAAKVKPI